MGITNFDVVRANVFLGMGALTTQGNVYHVKPGTGADGQDGKTPETAVKTLAKALSLCTANQNDIVLLYSESNTASATTDYQSTSLVWNKDLTHLIGVSAGGKIASRARISQLSSATAVTPLLSVTANGCLIKNIHLYSGVDAASLVCVQVSGERNVFENVHMGAGAGVISAAGAADLKVTGSENLFKGCTIGLDTVTRDADTEGNVWLDGAATRNIFEDCIFPAHISNVGYEHVVLEDATAIDRYVMFKCCLFMSISANAATPQDQIFEFKATLTQGHVILANCHYITDDASCVWVTSGTGNLRNTTVAPTASGAGGEATIL